MAQRTTIGGYLIHRLEELGVKHVFGVPGDYVLGFYDQLVASPLEVVGTCTEIGAGFAGDAYARVNGLGAVCITYCVGGFNALNAVAGAYAEKSPLVLISGAPGLSERERSPFLHHKVRDFNTQRLIYERVTAAAVALENADDAPELIDAALDACLRQKRPTYIEIPRDMATASCVAPKPWKRGRARSDPQTLREAVAEAAEMLRRAKRPVILGGVEIHRFGLQNLLVRLVEHTGMPIASTLLGKSMMEEDHPQYLGVYEGGMGRDDVRRVVERADCLMILGAFLTDIDLGIFTAKLDPAKTIDASAERIAIKRHVFEDIQLKDFMDTLIGALPKRKAARVRTKSPRATPFKTNPRAPMTVRRLFERVDAMLGDEHIVICDIGDSLFGAADLTIRRHTEFLSPAYYTSMGFAVPAALGAHINKRRLRPIVFVGDGAFQMTGQELSTIVRQGLDPIVIVLNNKGYSTERFIDDGPYNDILNWQYHRVPELLGAGWGTEARTEAEFDTALAQANDNRDSFSIVNVHLDPYDSSRAMERLGQRLGTKVRSSRRRHRSKPATDRRR
ncbi:MAG: alpha-keto acid decarboxylase family protein [Candidatus Hydrogenedentes bacterium]|nr:alpha-keto acid decarboxylase family protein [Candidatus Hydrogenedentota bacterium]